MEALCTASENPGGRAEAPEIVNGTAGKTGGGGGGGPAEQGEDDIAEDLGVSGIGADQGGLEEQPPGCAARSARARAGAPLLSRGQKGACRPPPAEILQLTGKSWATSAGSHSFNKRQTKATAWSGVSSGRKGGAEARPRPGARAFVEDLVTDIRVDVGEGLGCDAGGLLALNGGVELRPPGEVVAGGIHGLEPIGREDRDGFRVEALSDTGKEVVEDQLRSGRLLAAQN